MVTIRIGTTKAHDGTKFSLLAKLLCRFLNANCSFVYYPNFRDMLLDIRDGRIDASIPDATLTAERTHWLDFSNPLFDSTNSYVVDGVEASFCVDPLNTFDRFVYILTAFATILLGLLPFFLEKLLGQKSKRWKCPLFASLSILEATALFFEGMLVTFYSAEMKDTMTGVCTFAEQYSTDQLQDAIVQGTFNVLYTPITQGKSYLEIALAFQNRSIRTGFDRHAVHLETENLGSVFDCESVARRRQENVRYLYVDNTGRILEYLKREIQQCCVEVYVIEDLPVEFLGFAITKGSNLTAEVSRAVDWLHAQGFVARAQVFENIVLPKCDKEAQAAFAQEPSTLDEFALSFILLLSGLGAAFGAFVVESVLHAYVRHFCGRWSVKRGVAEQRFNSSINT